MSGHKDRISHFKMIDGLLLECVQFERVLMMQVKKKQKKKLKGEEREIYFVSHLWHQLMEVTQRGVNIDDVSPITLLCRWTSGTTFMRPNRMQVRSLQD
jgi:hypothetical protein